ncbi:MAG: hypothetical protein ACK4VV_00755, partial [Pseudomonas sp.]
MIKKDLPTGSMLVLALLLTMLLLSALLSTAGVLTSLPGWLVAVLASVALIAAGLGYQQQRRLAGRVSTLESQAAGALERNIQVMSAVSDV